MYWLIMAGRGFGKTRTGAEFLANEAMLLPNGRFAVVAPTYPDVRDICIEGESGLLAVLPPAAIRHWNRSMGELYLWNNCLIKAYGADRPDKMRGPQFHGAWCDELAAWRKPEAFDNLEPGVRLGKAIGYNPWLVCTTTPKPVRLVRDLVTPERIARGEVVVSRGSTSQNEANLPASFLSVLYRKYKGTRLGKQELGGELLTDVPGALWKLEYFEKRRRPEVPKWEDLKQCVVAVDPAASNNENSSEHGIAVCAKEPDGFGLVLEDLSISGSPEDWGKRVVLAYDRWHAEAVIIETNNGGDMAVDVVKNAAKFMWMNKERSTAEITVKQVKASKGKATRADPVAQLYEQGRIGHCGFFDELENQMCQMTPDFDASVAGYSPDRVDAVVWGFSYLFLGAEEAPEVSPLVEVGVSHWRGDA